MWIHYLISKVNASSNLPVSWLTFFFLSVLNFASFFSHSVGVGIYIQYLFCVFSSDVVVLFVPHRSVECGLNSCADVNTYCINSRELTPRCSSRGFVWSAYEGGPVHHQRSRDSNAWRDAYLAPELWVKKTIILLLEYQRIVPFGGQTAVAKCKNCVFLCISQKYIPRRDLLQLH